MQTVNPNREIRNPKQIRRTKGQMTKTRANGSGATHFGFIPLELLNLLRISDFVLRISGIGLLSREILRALPLLLLPLVVSAQAAPEASLTLLDFTQPSALQHVVASDAEVAGLPKGLAVKTGYKSEWPGITLKASEAAR